MMKNTSMRRPVACGLLALAALLSLGACDKPAPTAPAVPDVAPTPPTTPMPTPPSTTTPTPAPTPMAPASGASQ